MKDKGLEALKAARQELLRAYDKKESNVDKIIADVKKAMDKEFEKED